MKYILILGGTGAMGKHLVSILRKDSGNHIYVTSRQKRKDENNVSYIFGNAHNNEFIFSLLKERHWNAIIDFMIYSTENFKDKVDCFLNATEQYIYLSSARVYAQCNTNIVESSDRLLDECNDCEYLKTDEYALAKARQENILKQSGRTNWTIIRPYITFSEIRLQLGVLEKENWLYRALQGKTIVFSKDILERKTTLTYGYDVARGIAVLIGNEKAYGEIFHITTNESHTWQEILNVYLDVLEKYMGKRPKVLYLDKYPYQHKERPFYQLIYDRYFDRMFDNTKIGQFIDISTFTPTLEGLRQCLESFLVKGNFHVISWKGEAGRDRLTGECSKFKEFPNKKSMIKYFIQRYILPKSYF